MYDEKLEQLIDAALADGVLSEKEKKVLYNKAQSYGIDLDEFEMVLEARFVQARKKEKLNNPSNSAENNSSRITKCPRCGGYIPDSAVVCPDCGWEVPGIKANAASQTLGKEINRITQNSSSILNLIYPQKRNRDLATQIMSFTIPNTKSDLLEFTSSLNSKLGINLEDEYNNYSYVPVMKAYVSKYKECINKVVAYFPNDRAFSFYVDNYANDVKRAEDSIQRIVSRNRRKMTIMITFSLLFCIGFMVGVPWLVFSTSGTTPYKFKYDTEACNAEVFKLVKEGQLDSARVILMSNKNFNRYPQKLLVSFCDLIKAYLKEDQVEDAESLYNMFIAKSDDREDNDVLCRLFYSYYIGMGEYDAAESYISSDGYVSDDEYSQYLTDVVVDMCSRNQEKEAKRFVVQRIGNIENEFKRSEENERLNNLINNY